MIAAFALCVGLLLPFAACSPVVYDNNNNNKNNKNNRIAKPYGYAPYVWISVLRCAAGTSWCQGYSKGSFALTVDIAGREDPSDQTCTHYCSGKIYASWRPDRSASGDLSRYERQGVMLGAYVLKLDRDSCVEIPGKFPCADRVVSSIPINKVSVMLHANERNREYFFGDDPAAQCDPDPQCATYKLLRRTLYATEGNRTWPDTDDVLSIRNSPYACVLSYVGLGDSESIGLCYTQLGDNCFRSNGNTFCIGRTDTNSVGITNADEDASAPIAMCEISSAAELLRRDVLSRPTTGEIEAFIASSSCDATIVSADNATYASDHLSLDVDIDRFHALSEFGHVILRIPLDRCVVPVASTDGGYASTMQNIAKTLHKTAIATYASAIMLDASDWGSSACSRDNVDSNVSKVASDVARAITELRATKLFLRLPRDVRRVKTMNFASLGTFEAFVTPRLFVNMTEPKDCQNMWTKKGGSIKGIVPYVLAVLRGGVKANKLIATLSLTGGLTITPVENNNVTDVSNKTTTELTLADMESNNILRCEEDMNTKCCSGSTTTMWGRNALVNATYTSTSLETLKQYPELIAVAFGINQFVISPVDSDFKRKVRANTPAISSVTSAVHRLRDWRRQQAVAGVSSDTASRASVRNRRSANSVVGTDSTEAIAVPREYKDPASGSKNCLDPQYQVGLSNRLVCPGLIILNGALGVFKEPYKEMYKTSYDNMYIVNVHTLQSCTPGEPKREALLSSTPPQTAINIHTLVPTTDSSHYMVGILDTATVVEYKPPVNKVCNAYNDGETIHNMNVVAVDDGYTVDKPTIEAEHGLIVKPAEALYFVSNFTHGIDYINMDVRCIDYDVSAMQPCLIAICGGDDSCRRNYGRLCNSAHEIVNDARRASEFVQQGLRELAMQERKARMYELPDSAPFPWLDRPPKPRGRKKRFVATGMATAALGLAWHTSNRVDKLEEQTDLLKNNYVKISQDMVEVSRKLDDNIALVNGRLDEQEIQMQRNTEKANKNFALLKETMMKNREALMRDINVKFSVTISYQMWYAQMQSVTHQMMQAAMQVRFMARGIENCLRQIASKRSGSCPSGMSVIQEHPGLSEFPTVATALYKDRKLFIVHSLPNTVEKTTIRGVIPMPKMSTDGIPCWPDYKVWLINGKYYEPSECHGRYCRAPEPHHTYLRCLENPKDCKTVCAPCHKGVCYQKNQVTWMEGVATVEIESPPLKPFSRTHISQGPVSFADLLEDNVAGGPELELLTNINTSIKLISLHGELDNISRNIEAFDKRYDEITASRVTFGGWLSGFASDAALWTCVAVLMAWCTGLSAGIAYTMFCGGGGCGGGGISRPVGVKPRFRRRPKLL